MINFQRSRMIEQQDVSSSSDDYTKLIDSDAELNYREQAFSRIDETLRAFEH